MVSVGVDDDCNHYLDGDDVDDDVDDDDDYDDISANVGSTMEAPFIPCGLSRRSMKSSHHHSCKASYIILDLLQNLPKYFHN